MANTFIGNHEYKEEVAKYKWIDKGWHGAEIRIDKLGCACGKPKEDKIHKPLQVDRF